MLIIIYFMNSFHLLQNQNCTLMQRLYFCTTFRFKVCYCILTSIKKLLQFEGRW